MGNPVISISVLVIVHQSPVLLLAAAQALVFSSKYQQGNQALGYCQQIRPRKKSLSISSRGSLFATAQPRTLSLSKARCMPKRGLQRNQLFWNAVSSRACGLPGRQFELPCCRSLQRHLFFVRCKRTVQRTEGAVERVPRKPVREPLKLTIRLAAATGADLPSLTGELCFGTRIAKIRHGSSHQPSAALFLTRRPSRRAYLLLAGNPPQCGPGACARAPAAQGLESPSPQRGASFS